MDWRDALNSYSGHILDIKKKVNGTTEENSDIIHGLFIALVTKVCNKYCWTLGETEQFTYHAALNIWSESPEKISSILETVLKEAFAFETVTQESIKRFLATSKKTNQIQKEKILYEPRSKELPKPDINIINKKPTQDSWISKLTNFFLHESSDSEQSSSSEEEPEIVTDPQEDHFLTACQELVGKGAVETAWRVSEMRQRREMTVQNSTEILINSLRTLLAREQLEGENFFSGIPPQLVNSLDSICAAAEKKKNEAIKAVEESDIAAKKLLEQRRILDAELKSLKSTEENIIKMKLKCQSIAADVKDQCNHIKELSESQETEIAKKKTYYFKNEKKLQQIKEKESELQNRHIKAIEACRDLNSKVEEMDKKASTYKSRLNEIKFDATKLQKEKEELKKIKDDISREKLDISELRNQCVNDISQLESISTNIKSKNQFTNIINQLDNLEKKQYQYISHIKETGKEEALINTDFNQLEILSKEFNALTKLLRSAVDNLSTTVQPIVPIQPVLNIVNKTSVSYTHSPIDISNKALNPVVSVFTGSVKTSKEILSQHEQALNNEIIKKNSITPNPRTDLNIILPTMYTYEVLQGLGFHLLPGNSSLILCRNSSIIGDYRNRSIPIIRAKVENAHLQRTLTIEQEQGLDGAAASAILLIKHGVSPIFKVTGNESETILPSKQPKYPYIANGCRSIDEFIALLISRRIYGSGISIRSSFFEIASSGNVGLGYKTIKKALGQITNDRLVVGRCVNDTIRGLNMIVKEASKHNENVLEMALIYITDKIIDLVRRCTNSMYIAPFVYYIHFLLTYIEELFAMRPTYLGDTVIVIGCHAESVIEGITLAHAKIFSMNISEKEPKDAQEQNMLSLFLIRLWILRNRHGAVWVLISLLIRQHNSIPWILRSLAEIIRYCGWQMWKLYSKSWESLLKYMLTYILESSDANELTSARNELRIAINDAISNPSKTSEGYYVAVHVERPIASDEFDFE